MAREQFKTLTEPMYYILLSLNQERHGYEIMQYVDEFTSGRVKIGAGTLYNLLSRFQKEDIIRLVSDDGRKKTYILTLEGELFLEEEYKRLKIQVEDGKRILNKLEIEENKENKVIITKPVDIRIRKDEDLFF